MEHDTPNKDKMAALQAEVKELKEAVAGMMETEEKKAEREEKEAEGKEHKDAEEKEQELMAKKAKAAAKEAALEASKSDPMRKEMEAVIASARKPVVDKMLAASAKTGSDEAALKAQAAYLNTLPVADLNLLAGMLPDDTQTPVMPAQLSNQLNADAPPESDDDLLKEAMYG